MVTTQYIHRSTKGQGDLLNITPEVEKILAQSGAQEGSLVLFVVGSTAGMTTVEYEPGLVKDLKEVWEKIAPRGKDWAHHGTWGDDNGSSHIRAAIQGPSLIIPFVSGKMVLGTWQQIVLAEFDTQPRKRKIVIQLIQ
jgi:secondary thiamine-phosphate synthase enzyme